MLQARDITVTLGGRRILDGVGLQLAEGDWLMLAGPNGAGKTTLINAISGGVPCTGSVQLCGRELLRMPPRARPAAIVTACASAMPTS